MAGNKTTEKKSERPGWLELHPEVKRAVWGIVTLGAGFLFVLALAERGGRVGLLLGGASQALFGWGAFVLPALFFAASIVLFLSPGGARVPLRVLVGGFSFFVAVEAILGLPYRERALGGMMGKALTLGSEYLLGSWASYLLWTVALVAALFIFFNAVPFSRAREGDHKGEAVREDEVPEPPAETLREKMARVFRPRFLFTKVDAKAREAGEVKTVNALETAAKPTERTPRPYLSAYAPPPLKLLEPGKAEPTPGDVEMHTRMIQKTLENFGIGVEMSEVNVGPTVTQFTLKPVEGVKLSRIVALTNDLALALAAHPLRIEAPIPGRSLVGIEIPNKAVAIVRLRSILEEENAGQAREPLSFVLGRDVTGAPYWDTIARMPHLLIAGATGSGKSIAIHNLLTNLLYRHGPEELQLLLVDPKRVELMSYNGIPQLLAPVIVEPKKTVQALGWAIGEMERRYQRFAEAGARDMVSFHARKERLPYIIIVIDELADIMAAFGREVEAAVVRLAQMARAVGIHLVVSTQRPSIEVITGLIKANITSRMAFQVASQIDSRTILDMAGAEKLLGAGDMLYLKGDGSKPKRLQGAYVSEDEVKRVTDWLNKETASTAETFGESDVVPVLTSFDTDAPGRSENDFGRLGRREMDSNPFGETPAGENLNGPKAVTFARYLNGEEPLYDEAKRVVIEARRASASLLQRRLRVGYARAARLIDILEERGVIGPGDGAKAREVLVGQEKMGIG